VTDGPSIIVNRLKVQMVQILVADDDQSIRALMGDFPSQKGFDFLAAENGKEALEIF